MSASVKRLGLALLSVGWIASAAEPPADVERFASPPPTAGEAFLQLADSLGNPRRYCLDIPGFGMIRSSFEGWLLAWPLETHTCKVDIPKAHYFFIDQLISREALEKNGRIRYSRFEKCAEIMQVGRDAAVREDAWLLLTSCSNSPRQQFTLNADGEIRSVLDPKKCLTVGTEAHEAGNRAPNEPWYQRAVTLSTCSEAEGNRQRWRLATPPPNHS
jgi:Ricin-type beta-trefoil lectin domain